MGPRFGLSPMIDPVRCNGDLRKGAAPPEAVATRQPRLECSVALNGTSELPTAASAFRLLTSYF